MLIKKLNDKGGKMKRVNIAAIVVLAVVVFVFVANIAAKWTPSANGEVGSNSEISETAKQWQRRNLARFSDREFFAPYFDEAGHLDLNAAFASVDLSITWSENDDCGIMLITPKDELGVIMFEIMLYCTRDGGVYRCNESWYAYARERDEDGFLYGTYISWEEPTEHIGLSSDGKLVIVPEDAVVAMREFILVMMRVENEDAPSVVDAAPVVTV